MSELPSGTVTLLFTDIEESSRLWDRHETEMAGALARHHDIVRSAVTGHGGAIVKDKGDGFFAVFARVSAAVAAAVEAQRSLQRAEWPEPIEALRVRMALHTGTIDARDGDYHGPVVNRVARLEGLAHGGQVLLSESTRALARHEVGDEVAFKDLGEHRLRGLAHAEHVYQLVAPGLPEDFPPPSTGRSQGTPLPQFPTSFVGRASDISEISALLSDRRLVTLLGPGGIGKTRLAVECAQAIEGNLAGGAVFVDLAPVAVDEVPSAIAEGIGAHPEGTQSLSDLVASTVTVPTLMVLDNFEHVLGARDTVAEMLAATSALTLLTTSRSPLHIRGEQVYRVEPLASSGDGGLAPAVELFYDRAGSYGAAPSREGADLAAVRSICRRLDGLPLAIELVAAGTRLLSVGDIEGRLAKSLDAAGGGVSDLPERQQTIRATIEWSLAALDPGPRHLFSVLSVFPAGATLRVLEAVVDGDDLLSDLAALVDASLVHTVTDLPGGTRYRQLAPIREYGAELLAEAGETDEVMGRLVDYYVGVAPALSDRLEQGPEAERELATEHANLVRAMRWSLDRGRADDMVGVLADVWIYWFNGDHAAVALDWTHRADALVDSPRLDWLVGFFGFQAGEYEAAAGRMARAVEGFVDGGSPVWLARARAFAGALLPDPEQGREPLEAALDTFDASGHRVSRYVTMIFLSGNAMQRGDVDAALALRRKVLEAAEEAEYPVLIAWAHWNLALALYAVGDLEAAAEHNERALRHMILDRYQEGIASAVGVVALVDVAAGRFGRALRLIGAARRVWDGLGVIPWPELTAHQDAALSRVEDEIGKPEMERLLEEGAALSLDELIELVSP